MRYSALAVGMTMVSSISAQQIPTCADQCFENAINAAGCGLTDYYCQCTSGRQAITDSVTQCLFKSSCSQNDLSSINAAVSATCSAALASASASATSIKSTSEAAMTGSTVSSDSSSTARTTSSTTAAIALSVTQSSQSASTTAAPPSSSASTGAAMGGSLSPTSDGAMVKVEGVMMGLSLLAILVW